jgi:uncharacterized protein YfaS (alpha-2-macroglobulin family)
MEMKKSVVAAISILFLVAASAAVYLALYDGLSIVNLVIQHKPNQVQVLNYSAEIGTLKPQISSVSNNVSSLSTIKNEISDLKGKLSDLTTKISQAQQVAPISQKPVMVLDRSSYFQGDTIHIAAVGLDPQTPVNIQVVDSTGFVGMHRNTSSDSAGKLSFDFPLSLTVPPGSYEVRMIAGQKAVSQPITIMILSVTSSSLYQFTAQTSKGVYQAGDLFEIFGIGAPNTAVSSILTSPSGRTFTSNTITQADGSYALFFGDSSHETGNWQFTVNNHGLERAVYFTVTPNPPVTYLFTAQALSSIYQVGDLIKVSGTAQPFTVVNAVLTSPSGLTYDTTTTASSDGSYIVSFSTSQSFETGNWYITLTNQGQSRQVSILIGSASSSSGSDTFTAQTDKTIYRKGDMIRISGTAQPFTNVSSVITSPSGATYNGDAMTNFDGSYNITYLTSPSFETGSWHITLHNGILTQVVSIFLEP